MSYNRYKNFIEGDSIKIVPFIPIPKLATDKHIVYTRHETRLDVVSYDYYGDPGYAWLIMQANPEAGSLEFNIADNTPLRIPYPLNEALIGYDNAVSEYYRYYKSDY